MFNIFKFFFVNICLFWIWWNNMFQTSWNKSNKRLGYFGKLQKTPVGNIPQTNRFIANRWKHHNWVKKKGASYERLSHSQANMGSETLCKTTVSKQVVCILFLFMFHAASQLFWNQGYRTASIVHHAVICLTFISYSASLRLAGLLNRQGVNSQVSLDRSGQDSVFCQTQNMFSLCTLNMYAGINWKIQPALTAAFVPGCLDSCFSSPQTN